MQLFYGAISISNNVFARIDSLKFPSAIDISFAQPNVLLLQNNSFRDATSDSYSLIRVQKSALRILMADTIFERVNGALQMGTVLIDKNSGAVTIRNNSFVDVSSAHDGGAAIRVNDVTDLLVADCAFRNCYAQSNGGCVSVRFVATDVVLQNVSVQNSSSASQGGAVFI